MTTRTGRKTATLPLLLLALGASVWLRSLPLALKGAEGRAEALARERVREPLAHPAEFARERAAALGRVRDAYRYRADDGRAHVYLADYDSYVWLRQARNRLATGSECDAVVDGRCRDLLANAPVGGEMRYAGSLHVAAIVALHRLVTLVDPRHPLPATAFLVPVIVGTLGMLPAFAIGRLLAGDLGGLVAAVVATLSPLALVRSVGSDNDVWNVVLPLFLVWAAMRALAARAAAPQLAWAALAGIVLGLHAAAWRGWTFLYAVVLAGLAAVVLVRAARAALASFTSTGTPGTHTAGGALRVLVAFYVVAGLAVTALAPDAGYGAVPAQIVAELRAFWATPTPGAVPDPMPWPSTLETVAELERPGRETIAITMGGPLFVFAGSLGLLAMLLPPRAWRWWHFAALIAGNFLYLRLITGPEVTREMLVLLLALPLAAAVLLDLGLDRRRADDSDPTAGGRLVIAIWMLGALLLAYGAARFVLLLTVPFGIAVGVAAGRVHGWLAARAARLPARMAPAAHVLAAAAVLLVLGPPLQRAYRIMAPNLPEIHDAWWDTLRDLRARTPAGAVVATWWDYGHWVKYVAERPTSADGGTLLTHVPHWLARALRAPSLDESRGILRMLSCGSDATPEPEGRLGAYGTLTACGVPGPEAYRLIVALAPLGRAAARDLLAARGLDAAAEADVLAATHCEPPPTFLVVTTELTAKTAWLQLGRWRPPGSPPEAAPSARPFLRRGWLPCVAGAAPDERRCPLAGGAAADVLEAAFVYERGAPERGRLATFAAEGGGPVREYVPGTLLLAAGGTIAEHGNPTGEADLAALVDVAGARVLLGTPEALRSTFTRLAFLDPAYAPGFARTTEHALYDGTRVVAWEVEW